MPKMKPKPTRRVRKVKAFAVMWNCDKKIDNDMNDQLCIFRSKRGAAFYKSHRNYYCEDIKTIPVEITYQLPLTKKPR